MTTAEATTAAPDLDAIADAIARELTTNLDDTWTAGMPKNGSTHYREITGPKGMSLSVHGPGWGSQRDRLYVSGTLPERQGSSIAHDQTRPKATYRADREPASIARDVRRRLMPGYREAFEIVYRRAEAHDQYESAAEANAKKLRAIMGDTSTTRNRDEHGFYLNVTGKTYAQGRAYADSVTFDRLSTTVDKAERIAAILAESER